MSEKKIVSTLDEWKKNCEYARWVKKKKVSTLDEWKKGWVR